MATSKNAKTMFESGQNFHDFAAMSDSGDHKIFIISGGNIFSGKTGFEPDVRPNGIVSGRNMLSPSATPDTITVAAFTAYSKGTLQLVSATTVTVTRPTTDVAKISSITMDETGAIVEVAGTESADLTFSDVRGDAGGPPAIPADSVEIGQVRMIASASAAFAATDIFQVVGTHAERFDFPSWTVHHIGDGNKAIVSALKSANVEFDSELPLIHGAAVATADLYKNVYIEYSDPIFAELSKSLDFIPAENTHSVTSTQVYSKTVGSVSSSLSQGGFTALMSDNITDALIGEQDEVITIKHYPDRNKLPYTLTQGTLGIKRTFPVADQNKAVCTISAEEPTASFNS